MFWTTPLTLLGLTFTLGFGSLGCGPQSPPAAPAAPPAATSGPGSATAPTGLKLENRDLQVKPGSDFFKYANGSWLKTYQLKPDEMSYGSFVELHYRSEDRVKAIIDDLTRSTPAAGSVEQKVADYYKSFMGLEKLNQLGIAPLNDQLTAIKGIKTLDDVITAFGKAGLTDAATPLDIAVEVDRQNPDRSMLNIHQAGLGLPDRDYYLEPQFEKVRTAYLENIQKLLGFAGYSATDGTLAATQILQLETAIAKEHWPNTELRQADKTNNPMALADFERKYASYPWRKHLLAAGVDLAKLKDLNVNTPSALDPLARIVKQTPVPVWKKYLTYHVVKNHASLLGDAIDQSAFAFFGTVLGGQPQQRDRWKRAVGLVGDLHALGEAIGKVYVERHFPASAKQQMLALVGNLRAAMEERLRGLDWMGAETKQQALAKLATFNPKIGYPDKWRDFSRLPIVAGDLMANYRAVRRYWYEDSLSRLYKPTDRAEWQMTPQTINAYYDPQFNEIVFPAAILQPPFFDPNADPAANYGGIGAVIGHEIGHGFDDQGSRFDARGVQREWWTAEDRKRFDARTSKLVGQYSGFEALPGQKVNGELTLGENIGDLGGITMAYRAYQISLSGRAAPVLDGCTGDQRFFLAWAQVWSSKYRDELVQKLLKVDPHSPARFRVNGVVRNVDAWYTAFQVDAKDALYLPAEERVRIW